MEDVWTEGHQQSEPAGHWQGLKERHRLHGKGKKLIFARPRQGELRSRETEGHAASRKGSNHCYQEGMCLTFRKRPFFKPTIVQGRTKFLNGVVCGLSNQPGNKEAERGHRSEVRKMGGARMLKQHRAGKLVFLRELLVYVCVCFLCLRKK